MLYTHYAPLQNTQNQIRVSSGPPLIYLIPLSFLFSKPVWDHFGTIFVFYPRSIQALKAVPIILHSLFLVRLF